MSNKDVTPTQSAVRQIANSLYAFMDMLAEAANEGNALEVMSSTRWEHNMKYLKEISMGPWPEDMKGENYYWPCSIIEVPLSEDRD